MIHWRTPTAVKEASETVGKDWVLGSKHLRLVFGAVREHAGWLKWHYATKYISEPGIKMHTNLMI